MRDDENVSGTETGAAGNSKGAELPPNANFPEVLLPQFLNWPYSSVHNKTCSTSDDSKRRLFSSTYFRGTALYFRKNQQPLPTWETSRARTSQTANLMQENATESSRDRSVHSWMSMSRTRT